MFSLGLPLAACLRDEQSLPACHPPAQLPGCFQVTAQSWGWVASARAPCGGRGVGLGGGPGKQKGRQEREGLSSGTGGVRTSGSYACVHDPPPPHTHRCTPGQASLPSVTTSPDRGSTQSWPLPTPPCALLPPSAQGSPPDSTQMRAQEGSAHAKAWPCARVWAVSGSRGSKDTRGAWGTSCSPGCRGERGRWKGAESHGEGTRPHHAVINSSSVAVGRREVHDPTTGTWVGRDISG